MTGALGALRYALATNARHQANQETQATVAALLTQLTPREHEVMQLVLAGLEAILSRGGQLLVEQRVHGRAGGGHCLDVVHGEVEQIEAERLAAQGGGESGDIAVAAEAETDVQR